MSGAGPVTALTATRAGGEGLLVAIACGSWVQLWRHRERDGIDERRFLTDGTGAGTGTGTVRALAFLEGGRGRPPRLAYGGDDGRIVVVDLHGRRPRLTIDVRWPVTALAPVPSPGTAPGTDGAPDEDGTDSTDGTAQLLAVAGPPPSVAVVRLPQIPPPAPEDPPVIMHG